MTAAACTKAALPLEPPGFNVAQTEASGKRGARLLGGGPAPTPPPGGSGSPQGWSEGGAPCNLLKLLTVGIAPAERLDTTP
jgi:hypothetical protein